MNWKWLLGGLGVLGVLAYFAKSTDRTVVVDHEPERVRPGAPDAPAPPTTSTTTSAGAWSYAPFIVEVLIRANFLEKPVALGEVQRGGANLARQLAGQAAAGCPGFPIGRGTAPKSVSAAIVDEGVKMVVTWPSVVWSGSTPEFTSCITRLLRGLENGDRVLRVVVR